MRISGFSEEPGDAGRDVGPKPNVVGPHVGVDIKGHQESRKEKPQAKIEKVRQRVGGIARAKPRHKKSQAGKEQSGNEKPQSEVARGKKSVCDHLPSYAGSNACPASP